MNQGEIELYVDPCCPFAWIAYQWLGEVRRRSLELGSTEPDSRRPASTGRRAVHVHTAIARNS